MGRRTYFKGGELSYTPATHRSHFEDRLASQIKSLKIREAYEEQIIRYIKPASEHVYTPDFILPNGIIVEAKGILQLADRQKHLLIKEQYPQLDIRFVFQNPKNKIRKGSKTTYGEWADKHGFLWSTRYIPEAWLHEKPKNTQGLIKKKKKRK